MFFLKVYPFQCSFIFLMKYCFSIGWLFLITSSCIQELDTLISTPTSYDATAKVIYLKDGDSFVVLDHHQLELEVRLRDIDAPELHQPFGKKAKEYLSNLIKGKTIGLVYDEKDKYGRILADVYLDSVYVNLELLQAGYAWHYDRFSDNENLQAAEDVARNAKKGLWQDAHPIAPWVWRKK